MNGLCCLLSILCRKQCKKDYRDFISITNKAGMYIIYQLKAMKWTDTFWSTHCWFFYDVYPASSCVCLLVELHINACITFKVLQISMMGSGLSSDSITKTYIFKPAIFHWPFLIKWLFGFRKQEEGRAADSDATQHIKTLLLRYWVHLLFDVIQWQPLYKSFKDVIV